MLPYKLSNGPNDNFTNNSNSWKIFQKTSKQKLCRKRRFWNVSPIASDHNIDEKLQSNPKHSFQQQSGSRKKFGRKRLSYLNHVKVVDQPSSIDKVFTPNDSSLLPFCNQAVNNKEDVSGCVSSSESSFKTQKRCTKVQSCSGLMNSLSNGGRSASSSLVNLFKSFSSIKKDSCVNVKPSQNSIDDEDVIVIPNNSSDFCLTAADMKHCVENIVNNFVLNETVSSSELTATKIANRMKSLYHKDFSNQLNEIEKCMNCAKKKSIRTLSQMKEVRPGLRQSDLHTLNPEEWLNDVIINMYIELIAKAKPWVSCVSSFFFEALERHGKHTLPEDWFEKQSLLIPLCIDNHWSLLRASPNEQFLQVYNSLNTSDKESKCIKCFPKLDQIIEKAQHPKHPQDSKITLDRISYHIYAFLRITEYVMLPVAYRGFIKGGPIPPQPNELIKSYLEEQFNKAVYRKSNWSIEFMKDIPYQQNAYDCGVYVCLFARRIAYNQPLQINPGKVSFFRKCIKKELVANRIFQ